MTNDISDGRIVRTPTSWDAVYAQGLQDVAEAITMGGLEGAVNFIVAFLVEHGAMAPSELDSYTVGRMLEAVKHA